MKRDVYDKLQQRLSLRCTQYPDWDELSTQFPEVSFETMLSIYSQECAKRIRINHHKHNNSEAIDDYYRRYLDGETLFQISEDIDLSPVMLMRLLLEKLGLGKNKALKGSIVKEPFRLTDGSLLRIQGADPQLLARMQADLELAVATDHVSSPYTDTIRRVTGLEFEEVLCEKLKAAGIPFQTEDALRASGHPKTPDVKLEVPICVKGRLVNWIDSKASFCDESTYRTQGEEQFQGYVNRYGPGMVIYWFGFIDELNNVQNVLMVDSFPSEEDLVCLPAASIQPLLERMNSGRS